MSRLGRALGQLSPPARGLVGLLWLAAACVPSVTRPLGLGAVSALAFAAFILAGGSFRGAAVRLVGVLCFTAMAVAGLALLPARPGSSVLPLVLGLSVPAEGFILLVDIAIRAGLLIVVVLTLGRVFTPRQLLLALNGLPIGRTPRCLLYLSGLSLARVRADLVRLFRARRARGGGRGWMAVRSSMGILSSLIVRAGRSAERQAFALQARGFADRFPMLDDERPRALEVAAATVLGGVPLWLAMLP